MIGRKHLMDAADTSCLRRPHSPAQDQRRSRGLERAARLLALVALCCAMMALVRLVQHVESTLFYTNLQDDRLSAVETSLSSEKAKDADAWQSAGWLSVEHTPISYPVARPEGTRDVSYYLSHRIDGVPSPWGSLVLDERCQTTGSHLMIYGHRTGLTDAMFSPLADAYRQSTFQELGDAVWQAHDGKSVRFTPLCAYTTASDDAMVQTFSFGGISDVRSFAQRLVDCASARAHNGEALAATCDCLLTLVTCTQPIPGTAQRTIVVFCA